MKVQVPFGSGYFVTQLAVEQQWLHQDGILNAGGLDFIISCCAGALKVATTEPGREGWVPLGHPSRK
jgi:hypothetical protein